MEFRLAVLLTSINSFNKISLWFMLLSLLIPLSIIPGYSEAMNLDLQMAMKANQSHKITQDFDGRNAAHLNFTVDEQPSNGTVILYNHLLTYRPDNTKRNTKVVGYALPILLAENDTGSRFALSTED